MSAISIGLSDEAREEFTARAARSGRSLEEYVANELEYLARKPAPENWVEQLRTRVREYGTDLTIEQILDAKDADRR